MSDIYGQLTEHPEFSIEDPRHFTITIKIHDFEPTLHRRDRHGWAPADPFCVRCGYHKDAAIHPKSEGTA
jgi:hypothetical protein